jgi:ribosomal protein S6--L-glutamate ligase
LPITHHPSPITQVGWREWIALPELGLLALHAKVDTGAATSALFAIDLERYNDAGAPWVRFRVHPLWPFTAPAVDCAARVVDERHVTASSGHAETRPVIRTELRLGISVESPSWPIEVTLADRRAMTHPMLLGREALAGHVVVDAGLENTLGTIAEPATLYS